jgi:hypothetical protein
LLSGRRIVPGEGVTGWTLANRQPFYNADPKLDLPPALAACCAEFRTLAACPITHKEEVHGVVTLYSATLDEYGVEHRQLFEEAVRLMAATMEARSSTMEARSSNPGATLEADRVFSTPAPHLINVVLKSELMH